RGELVCVLFFFSSRRRHTRFSRDWSSDVCSSDLLRIRIMSYHTHDISLKRYMDDIRKTKPITREEEQRLFERCRRGDADARERLIQANMRFVLKVALQYLGCPIPLPAVVNAGGMGLIRAAQSLQ